MKTLWTALFALAAPQALRACPVCFQVESGPTTAGLLAAVLVLLAATGCVLAGATVFVIRFVRRS